MEVERTIDAERGLVVTTIRGRVDLLVALDRMCEIPHRIEEGSPWQRRVIDLRAAEIDLDDEVTWMTLAGGLRHCSDESGTHAIAVVVPPALINPIQALAAHHFSSAPTCLRVCAELDEALDALCASRRR
jgi:hypothetical protein